MRRRRPRVGDVVQFSLPDGRYAYARVLGDAAAAFYAETSDGPGQPPIGSREYQFVVGIYDDVLRSDDVPVVGHDPSLDPDDEWPPPMSVTDPITRSVRVYERGIIRPARYEELSGLEPAAVWDLHHVIERLMPPSLQTPVSNSVESRAATATRDPRVGASGAGIFEEDLAADIRRDWAEGVSSGEDPRILTAELQNSYALELEDPDDGVVFWLALAAAQLETGHLQRGVQARAVELLDSGGDLFRWEEDPLLARQRAVVLETLREHLNMQE